jgi:hypothetical protein
MARRKWPITDALWAKVEEEYLKTATDDQKAEYSRMPQKDKGKILIGFVSAQPAKPGTGPWRKLLIARLSAKAASGS